MGDPEETGKKGKVELLTSFFNVTLTEKAVVRKVQPRTGGPFCFYMKG